MKKLIFLDWERLGKPQKYYLLHKLPGPLRIRGGGVITKHLLVTPVIFSKPLLPQIPTSVLNHGHDCNAAASPHVDSVLESSIYCFADPWTVRPGGQVVALECY